MSQVSIKRKEEIPFSFYFRGMTGVKSQVSAALRRLRLLFVAEKIRYRLQKKKFDEENRIFRLQNPGLALPPDFFIYETYRLNLREYYNDGLSTAKEILYLIQKHCETLYEGRILDWGCGPARIVRHLPFLLARTEIYGTDYNEEYIDWCRRELNDINFSVNKIDPPTNYSDSFFDAIIGVSIFTHLSEARHKSWINELYRITKPAGILFITTQGIAYRSKLTAAERSQFDKGYLVTRRYIKEGNRLFSSFQPPEFMKRLLAGRFEIVEFFPGFTNDYGPAQDQWVLKKSG